MRASALKLPPSRRRAVAVAQALAVRLLCPLCTSSTLIYKITMHDRAALSAVVQGQSVLRVFFSVKPRIFLCAESMQLMFKPIRPQQCFGKVSCRVLAPLLAAREKLICCSKMLLPVGH